MPIYEKYGDSVDMNGASPVVAPGKTLAENAMSRFKTLFGPKLSARRFDNQRVEAIIKCEVLNRMSSWGMPESVRIR